MKTARLPETSVERHITLLAYAATAAMVMGVASVMPIIPALSREYGVPLATGGLIITAYTLPGILFAPAAGLLADRYGRKAVLVPSFLLFSLAGAGCAFAPDFNTLLFFRFLQGIGGLPLGLLNTVMLADTFSGPRMPAKIGLNMAVLSICTAAYPSIGGLLGLRDLSLPFLLPLLFLPAVFAASRTPLANPGKAEGMGQYFKELGAALRGPGVGTLFLLSMLTFILLYGPLITCFPALADAKFGADTFTIGLIMACSSAGSALVASRTGIITERFGARASLLAGSAMYILALCLMPLMPALLLLCLPVFVYGLGQGFNIPAVQARLLQSIPPPQRGAAMAVNGMLLRFGQTVGPPLFSAAVHYGGNELPFLLALVIPAGFALLVLRRFPKEAPVPQQ